MKKEVIPDTVTQPSSGDRPVQTILKKLSERLSGISYDDLSGDDQDIARELVAAGYLTITSAWAGRNLQATEPTEADNKTLNDPEKLCKIRYGFVWLLTDTHQTKIMFVGDRSVASIHNREWAKQFQVDMKQIRLEIFSLQEVEQLAVREREDNLKRVWLEQFEAMVRATYKPTWTSEGFWTNAHMLHGQGLSVGEAVVKIGDKQHLRLLPIGVIPETSSNP